jgi:hypothetical protein
MTMDPDDDDETIDDALRQALPEDPGQARGVLKDFSDRLGRPVSTLYVLDGWTDPFYIGEVRAKGAQWFARIWRDLGIPLGYHYRRIHYKMISQDPPLPFFMDVDSKHFRAGEPYLNTDAHWNALNNACKDAVALGLIPLDAFSDARNPNPILYLAQPSEGQVGAVTGGEAILYSAAFHMPRLPRYGEVIPGAGSFLPGVVPQPYHIEIWAEKSTMNDILEPLARRYRLNLITGVGELSATACREFINRLDDRPARIIYITDFDPAGRSMPVAVARKIEYELYRQGLDNDVQVRPIILTHDQCVRYRLPRTPIKETEQRAGRFEARFGEGATELDALEALHPGVFARLVTEEIARYWNPDHSQEVQDQIETFQMELDGIQAGVYDDHEAELAAFDAEIAALNEQLRAVNEQAAALQERMKPTWQAMAAKLADEEPEPEITCPEFDADEDEDPLFDSTRDYIEQIDRYKAHQGKPTERRQRRPHPRPMTAKPMTAKLPSPSRPRFTRGN